MYQKIVVPKLIGRRTSQKLQVRSTPPKLAPALWSIKTLSVSVEAGLLGLPTVIVFAHNMIMFHPEEHLWVR